MILYSKEEISEKENCPIYNTIKNNLMEEVKKLYSEHCKTVIKENKDTNKWKGTLCSWIGRINIVKMSIPTKAIYRINEMPIKIPVLVFIEMGDNAQIYMDPQKMPNSQSNHEKDQQSGRHHTS